MEIKTINPVVFNGKNITKSTSLPNLGKQKPSTQGRVTKSPLRTDIKFRPSNTNSTNVGYNMNTKSISIPRNEDLQPIEVTNPKKMNWWDKQSKNKKIAIGIGLIAIATISYFMFKKKK
jgi:hypothetical protein